MPRVSLQATLKHYRIGQASIGMGRPSLKPSPVHVNHMGCSSRFFAAEGCKLRLGAYTSYSTLCTYLESDSTTAAGQERNFWVKSRVAVLNQRHPERTQWKESAICTKTWNNSVLQLVQVLSMSFCCLALARSMSLACSHFRGCASRAACIAMTQMDTEHLFLTYPDVLGACSDDMHGVYLCLALS